MKRYSFLVVALLLGFAACEDHSSADSATMDTSAMHHEGAASADLPAMEPIPDQARVFFKNIQNNSIVHSPFIVEMGVEQMSVDTANGKIKPASGHHHILIGLDSITAGTVVPKDSTHLHFGNAQTTAEIKLPPGTYKLSLQFADALHRSYGGRLTSTVSVKVE
ncbi:MAG: DUF4399 domain-containing protein [Chitinophagaceae bacterium]